jgi:DNA-binding transcriptional LysR family regulator
MDRLEAMSILLLTVEKGSFSAAARELRIPLPTVSRKVSELEAHLGTPLLIRTTRRLSLTEAGTAYVAAAKRILEEVNEAERIAAREFITPRGELVLTAPMLFGRLHLLPIVTEFLVTFPEIDVRLVLSDRNLHLIDDHVDMAVRIGGLPDGSVANSLFTYLYWRAHADWLLRNQWLRASARTRNGTKKCLYFKFATEPPAWPW